MGYLIECKSCQRKTWANSIVDLIERCTDSLISRDGGRIKYRECGNEAFIPFNRKQQEEGESWEECIKGVIRIPADFPTYSPYVFLISGEADSKIDRVWIQYYKDTRSQPDGRLKHGSGPGGGPALSQKEFLNLLEKLVLFGCVSLYDIENLLKKLTQQKGEIV